MFSVSMKIKQQVYCGRRAISIHMQDTTSKLHRKLRAMHEQEESVKLKQAASYKSLICHELRTPL